MNINIHDKEIELKYSFRALMIYEKITDAPFQPKGLTEMIVLFYSIILASDKDYVLPFEEFNDWLDENPNKLTEFSEWLTKTITFQNQFNESKEEVKEPDSKKK